MATLNATLTLSSTDATSDTLSMTVTSSLAVAQKVIAPSKIKLSTGDLTLFLAASYSRSYVYLKNLDSSIAMDIDFGTAASFNLAAGEFGFFPWHASLNIVAVADSGTPYLEYAIFEA